MKRIPETRKGRTRIEFTPLSMYLRDFRAESVSQPPCPIGGRCARSVRRSPEFIARTVLLPERFRVDCAFGGGIAALSHSRRHYSAPDVLLASVAAGAPAIRARLVGGRRRHRRRLLDRQRLSVILAGGQAVRPAGPARSSLPGLIFCSTASLHCSFEVSDFFTLALFLLTVIFLTICFNSKLCFRHGSC